MALRSIKNIVGIVNKKQLRDINYVVKMSVNDLSWRILRQNINVGCHDGV